MPVQTALYRRRWLIFAVLALIYILVYFYRVSLAVVAGDLSRELQLTPQQLGSLAGILFYVYAVAQIPLGPMIDRLGSRLVISGCGVLTTAGGLVFAQADDLGTAMAARVLIGIGTAAVLMATFALFSHWYTREEFGRASSSMVAVGNLGNLAGTAPLALAVTAIGWRSSFLLIGLFQGVATLLVFALVSDRPPHAANTPVPVTTPPEPLLSAWRTILGNRDFRLLAAISFFWYGNYLALQGLWGGPYLMEVLHLSRTTTGQMLMWTSLGFIAGSAASDVLVRRVFRTQQRALIVGQTLLLVLMCGFLGAIDQLPVALLPGYFFVIGLAVSSGVMIYPLIRSLVPVRIVGTALTSLNFFVLLGAAFTQQLMGMIIGALTPAAALPAPAAFHVAFLFPICGLAVALLWFRTARFDTPVA